MVNFFNSFYVDRGCMEFCYIYLEVYFYVIYGVYSFCGINCVII